MRSEINVSGQQFWMSVFESSIYHYDAKAALLSVNVWHLQHLEVKRYFTISSFSEKEKLHFLNILFYYSFQTQYFLF